MNRHWFAGELETVASFWRLYRRDGITFGFTSHDRDLVFDDIRHRASPGLVHSAVRLTSGLEPDSAEAHGAFTHEAITSDDIAQGCYDSATVEMGLVDWRNMEHKTLFGGSIGAVNHDEFEFTAELESAKSVLRKEPVPRTSPSCRALFCGPGCNLPAPRFTHEVFIGAVDPQTQEISLSGDALDPMLLLEGTLRWIDGPAAGSSHRIVAINDGKLVLDPVLRTRPNAGTRAIAREGCDHRVQTCADRFGNVANFRGEPFLPGNDSISRYPVSEA
ncbi:DUF2163 domain-containing protein [Croceicoccus sp. F390]|uniref:DUF2163 domain-containing protein n=1 Tax=Croceicoccus esteveae TaxID=3075597 RepID=A0ABU2ZIV5_9SPHN|nr:DUF2163 domain-containing protein [Croceicoccus sp. F390]MDT0576535.1 DUF2163 domain-containing protein [Croceicoccus sp. F390]